MGGKGFKGKGKVRDDWVRGQPAELKVWLGGLPENAMGKEICQKLKQHMSQSGTCRYAAFGKKGQGVALYNTAEEAQMAIQMLNGSAFGGSVLQVDVWNKTEWLQRTGGK